MKDSLVQSVVLTACLTTAVNVFADDFCDEAFVSNLLISLESDNDFKSCNLQSIKEMNHDTSLEIIELLSTLKNNYLESTGDDSYGGEAGNIDLDAPLARTQMISLIDHNAVGGLDQLRVWATDVYSSLKPPKKNIMKLNQAPTLNEEIQERCEVKYRWRKLHALRNQILNCVEKAKETQSETDAEDVTGGG